MASDFRDYYPEGDSVMKIYALAMQPWNSLGLSIRLVAAGVDRRDTSFPWAFKGDGVNHLDFRYIKQKTPDGKTYTPAGVEDTDTDTGTGDDGYIIESDVYLNRYVAEYEGSTVDGICCFGYDWRQWSESKNSTFERSDGDFVHAQSILTHELGHSLGLYHNNYEEDDLMYGSISYGATKVMPTGGDQRQMNNRYACPGDPDKPPNGCKSGAGRTLALIPEETAALFYKVLDSGHAESLWDEARVLLLSRSALALSINTFIVSHLAFLESQASASPDVLTLDLITHLNAVTEEISVYASDGLKARLEAFSSFLEGKAGWTLSQAVAEFHQAVYGVLGPARNYPNPFNARTVIEYKLRESGHVSLHVYNLAGERVATLVDQRQDAGLHRVRFDGSHLASGVYLYRISAQGGALARAMTLAK